MTTKMRWQLVHEEGNGDTNNDNNSSGIEEDDQLLQTRIRKTTATTRTVTKPMMNCKDCNRSGVVAAAATSSLHPTIAGGRIPTFHQSEPRVEEDDDVDSTGISMSALTYNNNNNNNNNDNSLLQSKREEEDPEEDFGTTTLSSSLSPFQRMNRHNFHTKLSLALTVVTLIGFVALSALFWDQQPQEEYHLQYHYGTTQQQQQRHRWLNDENNQAVDDDDDHYDDDAAGSNGDYSSFSCNKLYTLTPNSGEQQCQFARTCNQGSGVWAPFVFCWHGWISSSTVLWIMSPFIVVWMVVLFRMLGSTAEDYFSPALEMLSFKLGLPPRFAGVSLLALGNGAADVSATVSAMTNDPEHGYLLSLGALTGAAMVISCVVSAVVVLVAGGIPCRGALVRDVTALGVAVIMVWYELGGSFRNLLRGSGGDGDDDDTTGTVGPETVSSFLSFYVGFVVLVLCADVYHRAVVVPRRRQLLQQRERQRQMYQQQMFMEQQQQAGAAGTAGGVTTETSWLPSQPGVNAGATSAGENPEDEPMEEHDPTRSAAATKPPSSAVRFSAVLTAFSNYDNSDDPQSAGAEGGWGETTMAQQQPGIESQELLDRPLRLHGTNGLLHPFSSPLSPQHRHHHHPQQQHHHQPFPGPVEQENPSQAPYQMLEDAGAVLDQTCGGARRSGTTSASATGSPANGNQSDGSGSGSSSNEDGGQSGSTPLAGGNNGPRLPHPYGPRRSGATLSWRDAWELAVIDLKQHAEQVWEDIMYNGDLDVITKWLLVLEIPFLVVRKITVPIPCEGFYNRGLIALSMALSPAWMACYVYLNQDGITVFDSWFFWVYWLLAVIVALLVMRHAPSGVMVEQEHEEMSLYVSTPIALYGFAMAATWIDTIANALVSLLDFLGIVLRIPGPIVGLTILAWGNSMSDLSANVTMARKGLANMAMTACFAGPFFNFLVGLGFGFSRLAAQTGSLHKTVQLEPAISAGFLFLALNSIVILVTGFCMGTATTVVGAATNRTATTGTTTTTNPTQAPWSASRIPKKYGYIALTLYTIYLITSISLQYTTSSN